MASDWKKIYDALFVKKSAIVGQGLYTKRRIPKGAKIGEFGGEKIGLREARRRAKGSAIVAIVELDKFAYDASVGDNAFRWINHSCDANTFIRTTDARAEFYARRAIGPGEELTTDYVDSHHNGKLPCRCGAKKCRGFI
ncbi:MAG TPA: SET domain-containing protein-lysine N-methyltransferase [Usitatibacter sp.]|nr:SET domain-containing protein-lysine N-methyltransferase [Usitatibacter sp.]